MGRGNPAQTAYLSLTGKYSTFLTKRERVYEGMRMAGVPEG
jgi:hypothetical protein